MMSSWYRVIYKQIEPIHIGTGNYGVINETRIFITGQMMWGALTNAYFKETNEYQESLFENITCFYPKIASEILEPNYKNGEFYLGNMSEREFRKEFVTTYTATAINPLSRHAKDETLHEIDIVLPKNIYWVGYLEIDDKGKIPQKIYIGGDSKYGFGLMELIDTEEEENYLYNIKKGVYQDNNYPNPILNFVKFENQSFEGEIELMVEFDFYQKALNPDLKRQGFYIGVGAKII
jgi:hypothetical protein